MVWCNGFVPLRWRKGMIQQWIHSPSLSEGGVTDLYYRRGRALAKRDCFKEKGKLNVQTRNRYDDLITGFSAKVPITLMPDVPVQVSRHNSQNIETINSRVHRRSYPIKRLRGSVVRFSRRSRDS